MVASHRRLVRRSAHVPHGCANLLGAHFTGTPGAEKKWASQTQHTYLRLTPELHRHPILQSFNETDILPFGGALGPLRLDTSVEVPLTFIPPFPIYPPETA